MSADNINKLTIVLEGDSKRLQAALDGASKGLKNFDKKAKDIGSPNGGLGFFNKQIKQAGALIASAFAVDTLIDFGKELVNLGAKSDGISRAFDDMALTANISLQSLRTATKGAVSDIDLMQQAVQARNFKIPLQGLSELFEFAAIRAQQTGESVDYLTRSIVLGIGRKSPLILDNLGITLVRLKEAMGKVGRESATVEEIFKATVKIAKEETEVTKMLGDDALTAANKLDGLSASFKNLKTVIGENIVQGNFFLGIVKKLTNLFDKGALTSEIKEAFEDADLREILSDQMLDLGFITNDIDAALATKNIDDLRAIYEAIENARREFRKQMTERVFDEGILPKEAVDEAAKSSEKMQEYIQKIYAEEPISKYAQEMARGFRDLAKQRLAELNEEAKLTQAQEDALTSINDKLLARLRKNKELYRQNKDATKKLEADISAFSAALTELEAKGESGSKKFIQYNSTLMFLQATLARIKGEATLAKERLDAFNKSIEAMNAQQELEFEILDAMSAAELAKTTEDIDKATEMLEKVSKKLSLTEFDFDFLGGVSENYEESEDATNSLIAIEEELQRLLQKRIDLLKGINNESKNSEDLTFLDGMRQMASLMSQVSSAFGQISELFGGADTGIGRFVAGFSKVVTVVAAAVGAMSAFSFLTGRVGDAAIAVGIATGVAGAISGLVSASSGSVKGGYDIGSMNGQSLYTEISGRNLRIVIDRDRGFSDRRGG